MKLKVFSCHMGGHEANVLALKPIIENLGMQLCTISDHPEATFQWTPETWKEHLAQADIVVCVQRADGVENMKSNNRASQAMSMGKPVICSPLPAYVEAVRHGEDGFIANSLEDWRTYLKLLRDDPALRAKMGAAAKESTQRFSISQISEQWHDEIVNLLDTPPIVDIIIPTWNNLAYLKTTVESIRRNTDWPYTLTVVNSGTEALPWLRNQPDIQVLHSEDRCHFSHAVNAGIKATKSPFVAILNDDLIVCENWLNKLMFEAQKTGVGGVNPFSNCDQGWLHNEQIAAGGVSLHPGMRLSEVAAVIPQIDKLTHRKRVCRREWLPFFSTVIPRAVIDEVGLLNEDFKSGCEDWELSKRITAADYRMLTTDDAVVFHFGGVSRSKAQLEDPERNQQEDQQNRALMEQISSRTVKRIAIYTGPSWEKWDLDTPNKTGIGGSETVVINLAREFEKQGHNVELYGEHDSVIKGGFWVRHYSEFDPSVPYDLLIVSRELSIITEKIKARKVYAVAHDIWFKGVVSDAQVKRVDKFLTLTKWHREFLKNHHRNIPDEKLFIIPNCFDATRYQGKLEKVPGRLVYASSLDRGLLVLLHCYSYIKREVPELSLRILYGADIWKKVAESDPAQMNHYQRVSAAIHDLKDQGVEFVGRVNQVQLAEEFKAASCWAYPTFFTETFCLTALEAMASETPIVASKLAGLADTVADCGVLIEGEATSTEYCERFVAETIRALKDPDRAMVARGVERVKQFSPEVVSRLWLS